METAMYTKQPLGCCYLACPLRPVACQSQARCCARPRLLGAFKPSAPLGQARPASRPLLAITPKASLEGLGAAGRNLMVAVDSSQDSQYACQWLVDNVYREGDTVHLVHCIPYFPRSGIYVMPDGRLATLDFDVLLRNEDQFLKAAEKAVANWCADVLDRNKVKYVIDLLREDPGTEDKDVIGSVICATANELQASVLVIASQAKSGLSEWMLGSVANYVAHHCDAPVLVLHRPKGEQGGGKGLRSWLPDLSALLKPKVKAEEVGGAAVAAAAAAAANGASVDSAAPQRAAVAQPTASADNSGIITTADFSSMDDNLLGQTADFPGIGSQAESSFIDSAAALRAQRESQEAAVRAVQEERRAAAGGRHLVIAVDDSDASERAMLWAVHNLYRTGDTVHIMHIIPAMPYRATYGGPVMDGFVFYMDVPTDDFKRATELYVGKRFVSKLQELGIPHQVEIVTERAEDSVAGIGSAICKHVAKLGGDAVVVVGSHTRGGLAEFMLGSVATYMTHNCTKPVAVLH